MILDEILCDGVQLHVLPPDENAESEHENDRKPKKGKVPIGCPNEHLCCVCRQRRKTEVSETSKYDLIMSLLEAEAFPVRCCTCNRPLYGKWKTFLKLVKAYRKQDGRSESDDLTYLTKTTVVTAEGRAMNELGLTLECCRVKFLTFPGV